jgi:peptidoglycan/LPS O-acetylase OafA/YrhL
LFPDGLVSILNDGLYLKSITIQFLYFIIIGAIIGFAVGKWQYRPKWLKIGAIGAVLFFILAFIGVIISKPSFGFPMFIALLIIYLIAFVLAAIIGAIIHKIKNKNQTHT